MKLLHSANLSASAPCLRGRFKLALLSSPEPQQKLLFSAVLLRGLDALSTEDSVLTYLMRVTNLPIKGIRIGRDPLTNTSRGLCYVEMNTIVDAVFLHNQVIFLLLKEKYCSVI